MPSSFSRSHPWARFIEYRENSLHGRDTNRKSLPFEWGAEHAGVAADGDAGQALRDYAAWAVANSADFYACSPTADSEFNGGIVRFPSAFETPYPENNTVWARFFDGGRDLGVVLLPQWNCKWDAHVQLCGFLQRLGISTLRLSLPYHHYRKPAHLERSEYLVSPNIGRTLAAVRQAVMDARRAADWLQARGHRRLALLGMSIGSCIGFLTFAHDRRFSAGAFIHVSGYYADVVWQGLSTKHLLQSLETAVDLPQLRALWEPISPYPYIKRLSGSNRRILMISGRYDSTFLPELSQQTYDEFDRWRIPHKRLWLSCGHYTMGQFPFNLVTGYRVVNFLAGSKNNV